jgi:hypothetical protein
MSTSTVDNPNPRTSPYRNLYELSSPDYTDLSKEGKIKESLEIELSYNKNASPREILCNQPVKKQHEPKPKTARDRGTDK